MSGFSPAKRRTCLSPHASSSPPAKRSKLKTRKQRDATPNQRNKNEEGNDKRYRIKTQDTARCTSEDAQDARCKQRLYVLKKIDCVFRMYTSLCISPLNNKQPRFTTDTRSNAGPIQMHGQATMHPDSVYSSSTSPDFARIEATDIFNCRPSCYHEGQEKMLNQAHYKELSSSFSSPLRMRFGGTYTYHSTRLFAETR